MAVTEWVLAPCWGTWEQLCILQRWALGTTFQGSKDLIRGPQSHGWDGQPGGGDLLDALHPPCPRPLPFTGTKPSALGQRPLAQLEKAELGT